MRRAIRDHAWSLALLALFAAALGLRLWGVRQGLPYVYNVDEQAHFVPRAIGFFGHDYDPHYFVNPPAFTYLVHVAFAVWFGGGDGAARSYAADPSEAFLVARVVSAVLGSAAVVLTAMAGARLLGDRRAGLVAGGLLAVAFLPVFYGHLALNDGPALAPVALALYGAAGVLRDGRRRDYALAGLGFGLAAATKYTAGIVVLALLAAALLAPRTRGRTGPLGGLTIGLLVALCAFVVANPYALLEFDAFLRGMGRQARATGGVEKLGVSEQSGHLFYLKALTWGLGWAPALAALIGAVALAARRADRRAALVLVVPVVAFLAFVGAQERYFGRWLMPALPFACVLAGAAVARLSARAAGARPRARAALAVGLGTALGAQGLIHAVHGDRALARADTREITREWMAAHVPAGERIVLEPVTADGWLTDRSAHARLGGGERWVDVTARDQPAGDRRRGGLNRRLPLRRAIGSRPLVRLRRSAGVVGGERYQRSLHPGLLGTYEREGACWVISGSTQSGRAFAQPDKVREAVAYYRELRRRARVVFRVTPYRAGAAPVPFDFDFSFDTYPLAYVRPGPVMTVYRLGGGRCR